MGGKGHKGSVLSPGLFSHSCTEFRIGAQVSVLANQLERNVFASFYVNILSGITQSYSLLSSFPSLFRKHVVGPVGLLILLIFISTVASKSVNWL